MKYKATERRKVLSALRRSRDAVGRSVFAPLLEREDNTIQLLGTKIESLENRLNSTELALEKIASALGDYTRHLASRTRTIHGLLVELQAAKPQPEEDKPPPVTPTPRMADPEPQESITTHTPQTNTYPPGCARGRLARARKAPPKR